MYRLPERKDSKDAAARPKQKMKLESHNVLHENLSDVTKTTRLALRDAFISRHCGRLWDPNTPDPSFFRDASIALLPSFAIKPILEFMKLRTGLDERALPRNIRAHVPTPDDEVQERSQSVWKEIRSRTLAAARTLEKRDGAGRSRKRLKSVGGSDVPRRGASCKGDEADDELAALLGDGADDDVDVDQIERSVNEEVERFQKELLRKKDFPLNTLAQFWRDWGRKHFTHMSYIAQQVIGHQASSAQIERDFSAAGRLLSGRRSRMDSNWAEMQLFLNANFERIPHEIPSISSKSIRKHLPKSFTARDDDLAAAEQFLDPLDVDNDTDDGLSEAEDIDPTT